MLLPKISVCLSVYNPDEVYLTYAVNSIISQSFRNWEMLVYDDGSDDMGKKIISKVCELDQRIRYIRSDDHHSLAYGLNESIRQAKGEYIARMDADDISHPDRLEIQKDFLESHRQYMWVGCNVKLIDKEGSVWGEYHYPESPQSRDFLSFSPFAHPSVMIRKEQLMEYGGYIPGSIPCRGEDYELFMRLHSQGARGYNIQQTLLYYRETKESYKKQKLRFRIDEVKIRYQGFRQLKMKGPEAALSVIRPLLAVLVPPWIKFRLKRRKIYRAYRIQHTNENRQPVYKKKEVYGEPIRDRTV